MTRFGVAVLLSLIFILYPSKLAASHSDKEIDTWVNNLCAKEDLLQKNYFHIYSSLYKEGKDKAFINLKKIKEKGSNNNPYFSIRLRLLQANLNFTFFHVHNDSIPEIYNELREALRDAYKLGDNALIAHVSERLGEILNRNGHYPAQSILYCLNGSEYMEKTGKEKFYKYPLIQELLGYQLFYTNQYRQSVSFSLKAISNNIEKFGIFYPMNAWNTAGLALMRLGLYDSALNALQHSMQFAQENHNSVWTGIVSSSMGQVYFMQGKYAEAKPLFYHCYRINTQSKEYDVAAYALQWLSRILLEEQKTDSAFWASREALKFIGLKPKPHYLSEIYYANMLVFRAKKNADSVFHYYDIYSKLHNKLETDALLSRTEVARLKLNNEKSIFEIENLSREKNLQNRIRNIVIVSLIATSLFIFIYINKKKKNLKVIALQAIEQKNNAETQLASFAKGRIEKIALIKKLEEQLYHHESRQEKEKLLNELTQQVILTEEDWLQFKRIFKRTNPTFFDNLKRSAAGITTSEQRMAALIKLELPANHMASMLGISVSSVHKTRLRLRQRLQLDDINALEETIKNL